MAIHRRLDSFSLIFYLLLILWVKTELHQNLPPITSGFQLLRSLSANKHFCRTSRAVEILYLSWFFLVDPIISLSPVPATAILKFFIIFTPPVFFGPNSLKRYFYLCTHPEKWYFLPIVYFYPPPQLTSQHNNKPVYRLQQQSIRRLVLVPPYSVFCSISFRCGGLSIERNQKPLTPESTLAVTHRDKQKQVEMKRSSRANPHEIRLFSALN